MKLKKKEVKALRKEHEEINERYIKYSAYMYEVDLNKFSPYIQREMKAQLSAMEDYVMALSERIRMSGEDTWSERADKLLAKAEKKKK